MIPRILKYNILNVCHKIAFKPLGKIPFLVKKVAKAPRPLVSRSMYFFPVLFRN